jgi:XPA protein C-terminus
MGLTEEQKERIRGNRERALELQRLKRKSEEESINDGEKNEKESEVCFIASKRHCTEMSRAEKDEEIRRISSRFSKDDAEFSCNVAANALEAFEERASEYVTKQEAMKMYCLPLGTLDVCSFIERPNPKKLSWSSMKLYSRTEIRQRAHKRFGGINGLRAEREKRSQSRYEKDMKKSKQLFR